MKIDVTKVLASIMTEFVLEMLIVIIRSTITKVAIILTAESCSSAGRCMHMLCT